MLWENNNQVPKHLAQKPTNEWETSDLELYHHLCKNSEVDVTAIKSKDKRIY